MHLFFFSSFFFWGGAQKLNSLNVQCKYIYAASAQNQPWGFMFTTL